jgi:hypothetical protein
MPLAAPVALGLLLALAPAAASAQETVFEPHAAVDPAASRDSHSDELPRLAVGRGGVWVLVWQVVGATDLGLGRDTDIVFARSADGASTWSAPKPLTEAFASDRAEDRQPALATDGRGNWMVVWASTADLDGGSRRDRDIHFSVSSDDARTWSAPRALNSNASKDWGDDGNPDVAVDSRGRWVVVWESADTLGNTKGGDRDILFATSTDNGKTWTAPDVVDAGARTDMAFDASPRIAVDAASTWMVAWSSGGAPEDRGGYQRGVVVARSVDGASTWSPPQLVSGDDDRPDFGPQLAGDGKGHWICAWSSADSLGDTIGKDRDLLVVRSDDGGRTWSKRAPLNREAAEDSGDDDTPELAVDGAGNWVAVWATWDRRGASRGADADLMVAMSRDYGLTWTPSAIVNSNATGDRGEDITPTLATDGKGLWVVAWSSTETAGVVLDGDRDIQVAAGRFGHAPFGPFRE